MTDNLKGSITVPRVTAPTPPPADVNSRFLGRLSFQDGYPTRDTVAHLYDQLDFQRACQSLLRNMLGGSMYAFREGLRRDLGVKSAQDLVIFRCNAQEMLLTANSETLYAITFLDLKTDGLTVVEAPPRVLGLMDDMWMRAVEDVGLGGPDHGAGGRYLVVPPGYTGDVPGEGYFICRPQTYGVWLAVRGFLGPGGDVKPAFANLSQMRVYPLSQAAAPPAMNVIDATSKPVDTIHPADIRFFEHLAALVNEEPEEAVGAENAAMLATIGIRKGKPFAPDERMRGILQEAAQAGSLMAMALSDAPRTAGMRVFPDRQWLADVPGYPTFQDGPRPMLDEMVIMAWFGTGTAKAMGHPKPGTGSTYAWCYTDAAGEWLGGQKNYRLRLPAPIPAKDFWSVVVYDNWTRSMVANGQPYPSKNSYDPAIEKNADGSVDIHFGPEAPEGRESNWIRTLPGQGWFALLRLYGPLQPWFDKTWKPGEFIEVQ